MDTACDTLLIIANENSKKNSPISLADIQGVDLLEADSENRAFEMIYTHDPFLVIADETDTGLDMYKIGSMLLSHKETQNIPLLIISDQISSKNAVNKFLTDFKQLQIDYIFKPVNPLLIRAKVKIFHDLFRQKQALEQSIYELDIAYKKIATQHQNTMEEQILKQTRAKKTRICITQMQQALPGLRTHIHAILKHRQTPPETRAALTAIKTAGENISHISNRLLDFKTQKTKTKRMVRHSGKPYKVIYFQNSEEEFNIFNHCLKSVSSCELMGADSIERGIEQITNNEIDLIFTDHILPKATGFDLLARLKQIRSNIPVIFTFSKAQAHLGTQAISKGAYNFFFKEDISGTTLVTIIQNTLDKAVIAKDIEDAMGRIVMIAEKDRLTCLYSPSFFKKTLPSEMRKAKRYNIFLTLLILRFDASASKPFLTTCAALIQSMIRGSDIACCLEKEIFAIILPHTQSDGAKILAQRIQKKIAAFDFQKSAATKNNAVEYACAPYDPQGDLDESIFIQKALDALPKKNPTKSQTDKERKK